MATQHAWKNDRKVTAMMVEDMMFNPILATKVILGLRVPPHEELRIMMMWSTYFTVDDSGFSTGKSFTIAVVAALRAILFAERVEGVLSKTFAQGQIIFSYFDKWANTNPRFRWCLKHYKGQPRLIHSSTAYVAMFRRESSIRVLPPNFMQDSERLKSERWHDGYFDEWTSFGNFIAFNKTVIGRVTRTNEYPNCPVRQNHIHLQSTPNFEHHPSFGIVKSVNNNIAQGNKDYARFSVNYRHVPDTKDWEWMVNKKTIFHMQTNLTRGMIKAEVDGLWQKDSGSYYSSAIIEPARYHMVPLVLERRYAEDVYIGGFDVARGGYQAGDGAGDDFSLSVFCVPANDTSKPFHCLTIRVNNVKDWQMAGIIHYVHRTLGLSLVGYDPQGGGLFVRDKLREKQQIINGIPTDCEPIVDLINMSGVMGSAILVPIRRADPYITLQFGKMQSDSVLINRIHKEMRSALENQKIILSGPWQGWDGNESQWDATNKRSWLNEHRGGMKLKDRWKAEMDLAVSQLCLVDIDRNEEGNAKIDSYNMYSFSAKGKKDSAYGLIYANFTRLIYANLMARGLMFMGKSGDSSLGMAAGVI